MATVGLLLVAVQRAPCHLVHCGASRVPALADLRGGPGAWGAWAGIAGAHPAAAAAAVRHTYNGLRCNDTARANFTSHMRHTSSSHACVCQSEVSQLADSYELYTSAGQRRNRTVGMIAHHNRRYEQKPMTGQYCSCWWVPGQVQ